MKAQLTLVGGGARSGKSRFAEALAVQRGARRVYVATARAGDGEMAARIARHVADRGDRFRTVEEPFALAEAVAAIDDADVVLIDCVTLWLSNLCCADLAAADIEARIDALASAVAARRQHTILVTNEVGLGIVPEHALARLFRDFAGRAHQQLAAVADEVYFGVMGAMMRLKPSPVVALFGDELPR